MLSNARSSKLSSYPDAGELAERGEKLRVLVVDDDEVARRGFCLTMRELGHECWTAADGVEALQICDRTPIDVILSDWRMPRMSGVELCRAVRTRSNYVYFIFATALDDKPHVIEGMRAGADDYIGKPIDFEELQARLIAASRVVGLHRALAFRNRELLRSSKRHFVAAHIDPLTGVRNRRALGEDLAALLESSGRYRQKLSAGLCDVDEFKLYNDRLGHLKGDEALQRIAKVMDGALRKGDKLYRYGGEEFLVVLPHQTAETATRAMERVRGAVEAAAIEHAPAANRRVVTISVGIAELAQGDGLSTWLARADTALYRAKQAGRNRVESAACYSPDR